MLVVHALLSITAPASNRFRAPRPSSSRRAGTDSSPSRLRAGHSADAADSSM
ncbi:hypothetical protein ACFQ60_27295 [Streptomyces zhihengii]